MIRVTLRSCVAAAGLCGFCSYAYAQAPGAPVTAPANVEPINVEASPSNLQYTPEPLLAVAFSSDGSTLAICDGIWSTKGHLTLWDVASRSVRASFSTVERGPRGVAWSSDGKWLATANDVNSTTIRDAATGQFVIDLPGHVHAFMVSFSPDSQTLATAGYDNRVTLWSTGNWVQKASFQANGIEPNAPPAGVYCLTYGRDNETLLSGGPDSVARVWDLRTNTPRLQLRGHTSSVDAIAISPDGQTVATGGTDRTIRLWSAIDGQQLAILSGHSQSILYLAFTPNSKTLASGGGKWPPSNLGPANVGEVKLWDVESRQEVADLKGHTDKVFGLSISPDGSLLATASWDRTVRLWDIAARQPVFVIRGGDAPRAVTSIAVSSDGRTVVSAGDDGVVWLQDTATGQVRSRLAGHAGRVFGVAFSAGGETLASAGADGTVRLWSTLDGRELRVLLPPPNAESPANAESPTSPRGRPWITAIAFASDGKFLASAGYDKSIRIWNASTGDLLTTLTGHTAAVRALAFAPGGAVLASASNDGTVRLWDMASYATTLTIPAHAASVRSVAFSADGSLMATGGDDHRVRLWTGKGELLRSLDGHTDTVTCLAFSPRGRTLASGGGDWAIKLWDPATGQLRMSLASHQDAVTSLAYAPDTSALFSGSRDRSIKRWRSEPPALEAVKVLAAHQGDAQVAVFSPDGARLATGGSDGVVKVWSFPAGELLQTLTGHTGSVECVRFAPVGNLLATAGIDRAIRLWDLNTGLVTATLEGHSRTVTSLDFDLHAKRLASSSNDQSVRIWNLETREVVQTLPAQAGAYLSVVFSPDGSRLVTTTGQVNDATAPALVKVWDAATGQEVADLAGHPNLVDLARYSPDGRIIATCCRDAAVRFWDASAHSLRNSVVRDSPTVAVAFLPDGQTVALGSYSGKIVLWDIPSQRVRTVFEGHPVSEQRSLYSLEASPDGHWLASAGKDGVVKIWQVPPKESP